MGKYRDKLSDVLFIECLDWKAIKYQLKTCFNYKGLLKILKQDILFVLPMTMHFKTGLKMDSNEDFQRYFNFSNILVIKL